MNSDSDLSGDTADSYEDLGHLSEGVATLPGYFDCEQFCIPDSSFQWVIMLRSKKHMAAIISRIWTAGIR